MKSYRKLLLPLSLLLFVLLLSACGSRSAAPSVSPAPDAAQSEATAEPTPEPEPEPTPEPLTFPDGSLHSLDEESVDLSALPSDSLHDAAILLRKMPALREVSLGDESRRPEGDGPFPWSEIDALQAFLPEVQIDYRFTLYGKEVSTRDTVLDFNHIPVDDEGAAVRRVLPCMKECQTLDMDFCGVSSESMAAIRDDFPDIDVIWRIWFGRECSVRTDCERILASSPTHCIADSNTKDLKYCTKVKYLDLGHNDLLHDFSFLAYMPDLEVAILAISGLKDLTPVGKCENLEYLEINSCLNGMDLSPLANCKKLHHLNICWLFRATGFRALGELKELERLWIGKITQISKEDLEYLREALPNTEINTTELTGCGGSWRENDDGTRTDRYELLRQQFDYDHYDYSCSSFFNDPKYFTDPNEASLYRKPKH